jgi:hypothetical protein
MTREEIISKWDAMNSRERNEWVAEDVMGWEKHNNWYASESGIRTTEPTSFGSFQPSEDMAATWEVVQKVRQQYFQIQVDEFGECAPSCIIWSDDITVVCECSGNTAQEAICKAILVAKLIK